MKNKLKELDVDFIGGQGALTKEEEKAISEYILAQKNGVKTSGVKKNPTKRTRAIA